MTIRRARVALMVMASSEPQIEIHHPSLHEGHQLWHLVRRSEALELNSPYAYLLFCSHFSDTCLVASLGGEIVGFVAAYLRPDHPQSVFVWQIGVDQIARGRRVASRILHELLRRPACAGVRYLEATVTPSNGASAALFRSVARDLGVACEERELFAADLFPGDGHEPEILFRIGPLRKEPPR